MDYSVKKFWAMFCLFMVFSLIPKWALAAPWAELAPPNKEGVRMAQVHYIVKDLEANKRFWIDLGAVVAKESEKQVFLNIPDLVISLTQGNPSGKSQGSVMEHIGFQVSNVLQLQWKMKLKGYRHGVGTNPMIGFLYTPDGDKIEFIQDASSNIIITFDDGTQINGKAKGPRLTVPIILHHIHPAVPESAVSKMKEWYIKHFGGVSCTRQKYVAVDMPGVNFNISPTHEKLVPTKGRMQDYIGFEVTNLEAFCKKLKASGVKFDKPYMKDTSGMGIAYLTDPWGISIVLTEGFGR